MHLHRDGSGDRLIYTVCDGLFGSSAGSRVSGSKPVSKVSFYRRSGKRWLDLILVLVGAPIWLPVLAGAALLARLTQCPPVFFRQARPGWNGQAFVMLKLRTMTETRDNEGRLLPDQERLTRVGGFLRRTSLDELPELFNVLRGDMSLVGPRPLLTQYLERYTSEQARRHEVLPGVTGWAQVKGRNALTWEQKFELDVWYVDHLSFGLDLKILALTIGRTLTGDGLSAGGHATMPEFRGTRDD